jgi:sucrose phosphorylase
VVARIVELIKLRNAHPAFEGAMSVDAPRPGTIEMRWTDRRTNLALVVDFDGGVARIVDGNSMRDIASWKP